MNTSRILSTNTLCIMERATLGGGCFWCLEAAYQHVDGVASVVSGYAGGHVPNPTYRQVCGKGTGHAEVVQVTYDPERITYHALLEIFFTIHNPTTRNREGADVGPQYRSIILYHNADQRDTAEVVIAELNASVFKGGIVTELEPLDTFYEAEANHQDYYERNAGLPYCRAVIDPKLKKLRQRHADKLRSTAV